MIHIESAQIVAALCTVVLAVVGFMITRAVSKVDASVSKLSTKVDGLVSQDTAILVQLEGLRVQQDAQRARIVTLEMAMWSTSVVPGSRGNSP